MYLVVDDGFCPVCQFSRKSLASCHAQTRPWLFPLESIASYSSLIKANRLFIQTPATISLSATRLHRIRQGHPRPVADTQLAPQSRGCRAHLRLSRIAASPRQLEQPLQHTFSCYLTLVRCCFGAAPSTTSSFDCPLPSLFFCFFLIACHSRPSSKIRPSEC